MQTKKLQFGSDGSHNIRISNISNSELGLSFELNGIKTQSSLIGKFNAFNITAAVSICVGLGYSLEHVLREVPKLKSVPGRQEWIDENQNFKIMVDYAYEPESQQQLYTLLESIPHNRIIHVTGSAGGGRDTARRKPLGELAGKHADIVIVTNEDPYDEDPISIIEQVADGAVSVGKIKNKNLFTILERKEAINKAITLAEKNDLVLLTGKGSEQAICIADGKKIPWDERTIVKKLLKQHDEKNI